jgi:hypothetical protein
LGSSKRGRRTKGPGIWNAKMRWIEECEDKTSISVSGDDLWRCLCIESRRENSVHYCYYCYYYYYYLLQLSFHSVAIVLTLVQTKQIRINIHKRNNTKTQYKQYRTQ